MAYKLILFHERYFGRNLLPSSIFSLWWGVNRSIVFATPKHMFRSKFCFSVIIGICVTEIPIVNFLAFFRGGHLEAGVLTMIAGHLLLATCFIWKSMKKIYSKRLITEGPGGAHTGSFYTPDYECCIIGSFVQPISTILSLRWSFDFSVIKYMKREGRQDASFGIHWRRWRQASTPPANTRAVTLTTYPFFIVWSG